jgi:hypothetical protein
MRWWRRVQEEKVEKLIDYTRDPLERMEISPSQDNLTRSWKFDNVGSCLDLNKLPFLFTKSKVPHHTKSSILRPYPREAPLGGIILCSFFLDNNLGQNKPMEGHIIMDEGGCHQGIHC